MCIRDSYDGQLQLFLVQPQRQRRLCPTTSALSRSTQAAAEAMSDNFFSFSFKHSASGGFARQRRLFPVQSQRQRRLCPATSSLSRSTTAAVESMPDNFVSVSFHHSGSRRLSPNTSSLSHSITAAVEAMPDNVVSFSFNNSGSGGYARQLRPFLVQPQRQRRLCPTTSSLVSSTTCLLYTSRCV